MSSDNLCPISREPPTVPVLASDGHVYDWMSLVGLCAASKTWPPSSPMTRELLRSAVVPLSKTETSREEYRLYDGAGARKWEQPLCMSSTPASLYDLPPSWWRDQLVGLVGRSDPPHVVRLRLFVGAEGRLLHVLAPSCDEAYERAACEILTAFGFAAWLRGKEGTGAQAAFAAVFLVTIGSRQVSLSLEALLAQHFGIGIVV